MGIRNGNSVRLVRKGISSPSVLVTANPKTDFLRAKSLLKKIRNVFAGDANTADGFLIPLTSPDAELLAAALDSYSEQHPEMKKEDGSLRLDMPAFADGYHSRLLINPMVDGEIVLGVHSENWEPKSRFASTVLSLSPPQFSFKYERIEAFTMEEFLEENDFEGSGREDLDSICDQLQTIVFEHLTHTAVES